MLCCRPSWVIIKIYWNQASYHLLLRHIKLFRFFFCLDFWREIFLVWNFINWPSFIIWLPLPFLLSWDIGHYLCCNCLLTRLWRQEFWNLPTFLIKSLQKFKYLENEKGSFLNGFQWSKAHDLFFSLEGGRGEGGSSLFAGSLKPTLIVP